MRRGLRVVITGIGAVTPIGTGRDGLWRGLRRGQPAGRIVTRFDPSPFRSQSAAEIDDFDPGNYLDARRARRLDRFSQLAIAASRLAFEDACLSRGGFDPATAGVYLGSALGGIAFGESQHERYISSGIQAVEPTLALAVFGGAGATNVAIDLGLRGPVVGNSNSCASGAIAIGEAFRAIRAGDTPLVLAGGAEAPLAPLTYGAFALIKAMSKRNNDPQTASRPFDRERDGFVMAEGAAVLVLEELEHARNRGATIIAEVFGYGNTNDAYHMIAPLPSATEAARAMSLALADAHLQPSQIGYLNAHATSTPKGDAAEALAIDAAFGGHAGELWVSATKGLYGHALGASGAIEVALTAQAIEHRWLPGTANLLEPDPACTLRFVPDSGLACGVERAISNSFGFGGINASLVLGRFHDEAD